MSPVGLPTTDLPRRKQGPPELWIFESLLPTGALARYSNFVVFLFKSQEQDRGWTQTLRNSQEDQERSVTDSYKRSRRVRTRQACSFHLRIHLWRIWDLITALQWGRSCSFNNHSDLFQSREMYTARLTCRWLRIAESTLTFPQNILISSDLCPANDKSYLTYDESYLTSPS